jgi:hypothetical protein
MLFGTNELVDDFLQDFTEGETLYEGWATEFCHAATGQKWLRYFVETGEPFSYHLLLLTPQPDTAALIDRAFASPYPDEVAAAASRLLIEEQFDGIEFRQALTDRLETLEIDTLAEGEQQRVQTIILQTDLASRNNRRDIMGKHVLEIRKDAEFFRDIALRAGRILDRL